MASVSELNTVIVPFVIALLLTVPMLPHAYPYEPRHLKGEQIPATLKDGTGHIHYWTVTTESTTEAWAVGEEANVTHELVIRGYKEFGEPAEDYPAFQALTSHLADLLRPIYTIPPAPSKLLMGPAQTPVRAQDRMLAELWPVYYSELRLRATERVTVPIPSY